MPEVIEKTDTFTIGGLEIKTATPYEVEALNNDVTTFGQVVIVLTEKAGHSLSSAEEVTKKIHKHGRAVVFSSVSLEKCENLIKAFATIGVDAKLLEGAS